MSWYSSGDRLSFSSCSSLGKKLGALYDTVQPFPGMIDLDLGFDWNRIRMIVLIVYRVWIRISFVDVVVFYFYISTG